MKFRIFSPPLKALHRHVQLPFLASPFIELLVPSRYSHLLAIACRHLLPLCSLYGIPVTQMLLSPFCYIFFCTSWSSPLSLLHWALHPRGSNYCIFHLYSGSWLEIWEFPWHSWKMLVLLLPVLKKYLKCKPCESQGHIIWFFLLLFKCYFGYIRVFQFLVLLLHWYFSL